MSSVREFYKDKNVFITGVSGFMGKVLLEKLLYSCSEVKQIFVLIREKKGKSGAERLKEVTKVPLFDRIHNEKPEVMRKIVPIYGDICMDDLGMSNDDLTQMINETNIIFHMAASVNFEEPIKNALKKNVRSVKTVIDLAKKMKNLLAVVHLSTAFCNTEQPVLDEKIYNWDADPCKLLECADVMNDDVLESAKKALLKTHPNIYTYTKRLAEILVREEYKSLPICVVRPSIVIPTYQEPVAGWVDNLNGPIGVLVAAGKGVLRTMMCDKNAHLEGIPVDFAIRGIILSAWETAIKAKPEALPVYNLTLQKHQRISWHSFVRGIQKKVPAAPLSGGIWYPGGDMTLNVVEYYFRLYFTQILPALFIDGLCVLAGRERFMMRIQEKIIAGCDLMHHFSVVKWDFTVKNIIDLENQLIPSEREDFKVFHEEMNYDSYLMNCLLGCRRYLLKDPPETIPKAQRNFKILRIIDLFVKLLWCLLIGWIFKIIFFKFFNNY